MDFMREEGNQALKPFIDSYQHKVYALVLYLVGGDKEKASDIAASSFAEVLCAGGLGEGAPLLTNVARSVVEKTRELKVPLSSEDSYFAEFPSERRSTVRIVKEALQALPFEMKALLLLRDQWGLPYKEICYVLGISEEAARSWTVRARIRLKEQIEDLLR